MNLRSAIMTPDPSRFPTRMLEDLEMGLESILAQEVEPGAMERLREFQRTVAGELGKRRGYWAMLGATVVVDIGRWKALEGVGGGIGDEYRH
jgi:hypothetical protein